MSCGDSTTGNSLGGTFGPQVCPTCNTCPTCGRKQYPFGVPFYPQPAYTPVWVSDPNTLPVVNS